MINIISRFWHMEGGMLWNWKVNVISEEKIQDIIF